MILLMFTFYDVKGFEGWIYAASNKGIWKSSDGGKTWEKVYTGYSEIDEEKCLVVSLAFTRTSCFLQQFLTNPIGRRSLELACCFTSKMESCKIRESGK